MKGVRFTSRCLESKLIEGEDLSTSCKDSLSGSFGDFKSANGELGDNKESLVVGDS